MPVVGISNHQMCPPFIHSPDRLTAAHHAHGEDRVVRNLRVSIVGKLAERVEDVEARVGHGDEGQS